MLGHRLENFGLAIWPELNVLGLILVGRKSLWYHLHWVQFSYLQKYVAPIRKEVPDSWRPWNRWVCAWQVFMGNLCSVHLWNLKRNDGCVPIKSMDRSWLTSQRRVSRYLPLETSGVKKQNLCSPAGLVWFLTESLIVKWACTSHCLF